MDKRGFVLILIISLLVIAGCQQYFGQDAVGVKVDTSLRVEGELITKIEFNPENMQVHVPYNKKTRKNAEIYDIAYYNAHPDIQSSKAQPLAVIEISFTLPVERDSKRNVRICHEYSNEYGQPDGGYLIKRHDKKDKKTTIFWIKCNGDIQSEADARRIGGERTDGNCVLPETDEWYILTPSEKWDSITEAERKIAKCTVYDGGLKLGERFSYSLNRIEGTRNYGEYVRVYASEYVTIPKSGDVMAKWESQPEVTTTSTTTTSTTPQTLQETNCDAATLVVPSVDGKGAFTSVQEIQILQRIDSNGNKDGMVGTSDFEAFRRAYCTTDPAIIAQFDYGNQNGPGTDGELNLFDVNIFVNAWRQRVLASSGATTIQSAIPSADAVIVKPDTTVNINLGRRVMLDGTSFGKTSWTVFSTPEGKVNYNTGFYLYTFKNPSEGDRYGIKDIQGEATTTPSFVLTKPGKYQLYVWSDKAIYYTIDVTESSQPAEVPTTTTTTPTIPQLSSSECAQQKGLKLPTEYDYRGTGSLSSEELMKMDKNNDRIIDDNDFAAFCSAYCTSDNNFDFSPAVYPGTFNGLDCQGKIDIYDYTQFIYAYGKTY